MRTLAEIQSRFYAAIMADANHATTEIALLEVLDENAGRAHRRLAAYRRGFFANLCNALIATYPVVSRIVGLPFFREAARLYILAYPSQSGDLNDYGADFPGFLAGYPHAQELPYLADVARLEWQVQAVLNSAAAGPANLAVLASTPPERYGDLLFAPDPCCVRLDSPWPLDEIWTVNQPGYTGDMQVDFSQNSHLLVWPKPGGVDVLTLSTAEAAFFDALNNDTPLSLAAEQALEQDVQFNFGATLQHWISTGLLLRAALP